MKDYPLVLNNSEYNGRRASEIFQGVQKRLIEFQEGEIDDKKGYLNDILIDFET